MRSRGWVLIQCDCGAYQQGKPKMGTEDIREICRGDTPQRDTGGRWPSTRRDSLQKESTLGQLDLGLPALRTVREQVSVVQPPGLSHFVSAAPAGSYNPPPVPSTQSSDQRCLIPASLLGCASALCRLRPRCEQDSRGPAHLGSLP